MGNLKFGWIEKYQQWLINTTDDKGVDDVMRSSCARIVEKNGNTYWAFDTRDGIEKVRGFLIAFGYEEFIVGAPGGKAQASYSVGAPRTAGVGVREMAPKQKDDAWGAGGAEPLGGLEKTYTVVEIAKRIKGVVDRHLNGSFWIRGEVSDYKSRNGHIYFSLLEDIEPSEKPKDTRNVYQIKVCIWRNQYDLITRSLGGKIEIKDGVKVRLHGKINAYEVQSTISISVDAIDPHFAEGEFIKRRTEIYRQLEAKGIHEQNLKLPMPLIPLRIALFSNTTAAGYDDFMTMFRESGYPYRITLFPVALQGREVESSFQEMFSRLEAMGIEKFDVGVIVRGGGSVTDLSYFNNLYIAEWVARSPLKFLIGIGHNRDYTVLDMIGYRLKTPTEVSIVLNYCLDEQVRRCEELSATIETVLRTAHESLVGRIERAALKLANVTSQELRKHELYLSSLCGMLDKTVQKRIVEGVGACERLRDRLKNEVLTACRLRNEYMSRLSQQLSLALESRKKEEEKRISEIVTRFDMVFHHRMSIEMSKIEKLQATIDSLDPRSLLAKGFAFVTKSDGKVLRSAGEVSCDEVVDIHLIDGKVSAVVTNSENDDRR